MRCTLARAALALILAAAALAQVGEEDRALEPVPDLLRDEPEDRAAQPEPPHEEPTEEEQQQLRALQRAAESGESAAQYQLGKRYAAGKGAPYDLVEARRWYQRAAENGNLDAANSLGVLLAAGGRGVPRDPREARTWLRRAAAGRHTLALFNLGQQHRTGELFERDEARALFYFKQAAELGLPAAQANLGTMYMEGIGVKPDPAEALRWWHRAADGPDRGDPRAQYFLGLAYIEGAAGTQRDEGLGIKYLQRAANQGFEPARALLGARGR